MTNAPPRTASDLIAVLALASALLLPFSSLPTFRLGYWDKAEPMAVWFHASAALATLAVLHALWRHPEATLARITHPFVLLPLGVGVWSVLAAPTAKLPLLSLFGAPQSGMGALWFLDLAAYTACALLVAERPDAWHKMGRLAIGVAAAVAVLKAWDWYTLRRDGSHLLIFVAAYYGWLALALPLITGYCLADKVAGFAAAVVVAVASHSMTAVGLLMLSLGIAWAPGRSLRLERMLTPGRAALAVMVAAVLPWLVLHTVPLALEKESLRDRFLVHQLIQADLAGESSALVFGHGWGRTQDALHMWLNISGERLWDPTWTFLLSDYFHSHNWALEALHAVGLPGTLLVLAGFVAIPLFARPECRMAATGFAIAVTLFHGLWFQLSLSIPLMAMAAAAVADRTRIRLRPAIAMSMVGLVALGQTTGAAALLSYGLVVRQVREAWSATPPRPAPIPIDFRGSDLAMAELVRDTLDRFAARARTEQTAPIADAMRPMLDFIDGQAADTQTILLLTTGLRAMSLIHVTGELAFAAAPDDLARWRRWLDRLLALAPGRSDQAIPYFTACIAGGHMEEVAALSAEIVARAPDDAVGLYYEGLVEVMRPEPARKTAGLSMIRRAIDHGLDRFMPIDPKVRALLGAL